MILNEYTTFNEDSKPCPFCGNEGLSVYEEQCDGYVAYVGCGVCDCRGPKIGGTEHTAIKYAIKAWNERG